MGKERICPKCGRYDGSDKWTKHYCIDQAKLEKIRKLEEEIENIKRTKK